MNREKNKALIFFLAGTGRHGWWRLTPKSLVWVYMSEGLNDGGAMAAAWELAHRTGTPTLLKSRWLPSTSSCHFCWFLVLECGEHSRSRTSSCHLMYEPSSKFFFFFTKSGKKKLGIFSSDWFLFLKKGQKYSGLIQRILVVWCCYLMYEWTQLNFLLKSGKKVGSFQLWLIFFLKVRNIVVWFDGI